MATKYLREDVKPVMVTIATAKAATKGDICGLSSNTYVSAADTTWDTNLATTQTAYNALHLGISLQDKTANVARVYGNSADNVIRVATAGIFSMPCASATLEVGDYLGPAKDTGNALVSNTVVKVASRALAMGRVVERGTSITRVKFRLLSTLAPSAE